MKLWDKLVGQLQQSAPNLQFTSERDHSAPQAKERLKLALTYDRNGLEQGTVEELRGEIVELMAKHLDIDTEDVEVNIDETSDLNKLVASIALRPPRRASRAATASVTGRS